MVKNPPANAGDVRDTGLTPGSGRGSKNAQKTYTKMVIMTQIEMMLGSVV